MWYSDIIVKFKNISMCDIFINSGLFKHFPGRIMFETLLVFIQSVVVNYIVNIYYLPCLALFKMRHMFVVVR